MQELLSQHGGGVCGPPLHCAHATHATARSVLYEGTWWSSTWLTGLHLALGTAATATVALAKTQAFGTSCVYACVLHTLLV